MKYEVAESSSIHIINVARFPSCSARKAGGNGGGFGRDAHEFGQARTSSKIDSTAVKKIGFIQGFYLPVLFGLHILRAVNKVEAVTRSTFDM